MERSTYWGHWSLVLLAAGRAEWHLHFPVGPAGPCDGTLGSPERQRLEAVAAAWKAEGTVPAGAVKAGCGF